MIPLIPALALAFFSFISSAFVILRIIIPILPPHPLSRRVPPSEFGLPNFRSLSPADKSHVWLASCDIIAVAMFAWQAVYEYSGGFSGAAVASDPASVVRLWIATTLRQSCLLIVASLTLLHVRLGRSVELGKYHWLLWAPTSILAVTSTAMAGVLAGSGVSSFFIGLAAYSSSVAIFSTVAFGCLIGTLFTIKRSLTALNEIRNPWPPAQPIEEKAPRPSFATEDIDALKDGSSWITSRASSRRDSISAFSFSTHHTQHTHHSAKPSISSVSFPNNPATASHPSIPAKSSFWFGPAPPVPPLPVPYQPTPPTFGAPDSDPFRRDEPRPRMGSQSSWLTEQSGYQPTLSAWSFPATMPRSPLTSSTDLQADLLCPSARSRPTTPAMASTEVLGGYGYSPDTAYAEKVAGLSSPANDLDISIYRTIGWMITIWVPLVLLLPYSIINATNVSSSPAPILLMLSITLSSPILACNILFRSPLPMPLDLFDVHADPPSVVMRAPSPMSTLPRPSYSHEYKRSGSVTVVEGRRSGDVWVANGDAVDGKGKVGRALGLLQPKPKLSVLPPGEDAEELAPVTPPLPMQLPQSTPSTVPPTPQSENSAELGRRRKESKASSHWSGGDESLGFATQIMIAQRHYSAVATTFIVPASPGHRDSVDVVTSGVAPRTENPTASQHLRSRSVSSISESRFPISPPPSSPLPPTPPSIKNMTSKSRLAHKKSHSHSSSGFSFGALATDDVNAIDALSAHMLPLLVPGLKVGNDVQIRDSPPMTVNRKHGKQARHAGKENAVSAEMGGFDSNFSSPETHSTPYSRPAHRSRKTSAHQRHHFSLPSLSLGKDGLHALATWRNEINRSIENRLTPSSVPANESGRRNTVYNDELVANNYLNAVQEEDELLRPISPSQSAYAHSTPSADAPAEVNTARNSLATLITALDQELRMPPSAASEVTLFDFNSTDYDGPIAESTPHESKTQPKPQAVPPVPQLPSDTATKRRSSIVYIKSDENTNPTASRTTPGRLTQWSSRAVRPLMPKSRSGKTQNKALPLNSENVTNSAAGQGLRPLSLLQSRDTNRGSPERTHPLSFSKKSKKVVDENASPNASPDTVARKGLRPLTLARSETTKQRAVLRKDEVLPNVVVRPPSQVQHAGFGYNFQ